MLFIKTLIFQNQYIMLIRVTRELLRGSQVNDQTASFFSHLESLSCLYKKVFRLKNVEK